MSDLFKSDESEFNMAFAYLKRIDSLLYSCQESAIKHDIDNWILFLRAVYRELSVKLKDNEMIELENFFKEVYSLSNNRATRYDNKSLILYKLDSLEIKLRKYLQLRGMLLPSKDDPKYAVLKR